MSAGNSLPFLSMILNASLFASIDSSFPISLVKLIFTQRFSFVVFLAPSSGVVDSMPNVPANAGAAVVMIIINVIAMIDPILFIIYSSAF